MVYSISDLPNGTHTIRGVKKSGQFMLLDKLDVRQESLLNPDTAAFDKNPSAQADVSVRDRARPRRTGRDREGRHRTSSRAPTTPSTASVVTIKKAYLAAQPTGTTTLDFRFRGDYRDDVHAATVNGAAIEFTFQGTGVDWVTALARTRAKPTSTSTASSYAG